MITITTQVAVVAPPMPPNGLLTMFGTALIPSRKELASSGA